MSNYKLLLKQIKGFVFDVDGVFTDGQVYLLSGRNFMRSINIRDGFAVQHAVKMGFPIAIITGGNSQAVKKRFEYLGVKDIYLRSSNKIKDYEHFRRKYNFEKQDLLYMGDDLPDYEIMLHTGLSACPSDAAHEIQEVAKYISDKKGGDGCVRDIIEQVLRVHDKWLVDGSFQW
jgi:3-deoxy-D-manno-octulosonate 8-phosphate phosphatase (KDO 8-P phosphatase)